MSCALLKQRLSYEELAFHLEDWLFARLPMAWSPKKSVLHQTIGALRAETWEAVNQALLASKADKLESGATCASTARSARLMRPATARCYGTRYWS